MGRRVEQDYPHISAVVSKYELLIQRPIKSMKIGRGRSRV